ncbi:MAG: hypothetical protein A2945_02185 [Candidatus Liptonbacteria bacterium RIFCSPLOWO2_01_FULL_52_25]|uniref:Uncharacterized protein n=1 Tax=Candidatus Liptonbacteria bacterium RIFCSPLOWO2_01_FULL_52_25 TaxID=1798650 RepID=A0A1G2CEF6_9BACT|nr:MAG: hypothetical protein A2945_02185 [Candidatus Liptonbacteria bacterium RIFCSPLOWO2_01_FULL_52_25]
MHENILRFLGRTPQGALRMKITLVAAVVFVILFGTLSNATPVSAALGDSCPNGASDCDTGEACSVGTLTCVAAPAVTSGSSAVPKCGTFAFGCKLVEASSRFVANIAYAINVIISLVVGLIVSVETWVVGIVLAINNNVVNALIVQTGFGITLALANLGFVLGIIVVALATILRSQTYGIKQILWKLVVAAILVNFGLTIAGVFINFSTSLTTYFTDGFGGPVQFAVDITAVFQPQRYVKPEVALEAESLRLLIPISTGIGSIIAPISSVLLGIIGMLGVVITLGTLIVMLLIRYVYLAFLLILMPLAWVCWVFPSLRSHWSKWWSTFLRWTFFPPLVVFFIWLVLQMGRAINIGGSPGNPFSGITIYSDPNNNILQGMFFPIIQNTLNNILIIALLMGGLFAANSLSIKGAGAGMKAFGAAKGAILGYYGKQTKKAGRAVLQTKPAQNLQERWQGGQGRFLPKRLQTIMGKALATGERAGGGELVEKEAKGAGEIAAKNPKEVARLLENKAGFFATGGGITTEKQMAYLQQSLKNEKVWKELQKNKSFNGEPQSFTHFLREQEVAGVFKANHQEELLKGLKIKSGLMETELTKTIEDERKKPDVARAEGEQRVLIGKAKSGSLTDDDREKMAGNEVALKALNEAKEKLDTLYKKSPERAGAAFQDDELARARFRAEGRQAPIPIEKESIERIRKAIAESFASWSPNNVREMLTGVAKDNNLGRFEQYFEKLSASTDEKDQRLFASIQKVFGENGPLKNWSQKGPAQALVNLPKILRVRFEGEVKHGDGEEEGEEGETTPT